MELAEKKIVMAKKSIMKVLDDEVAESALSSMELVSGTEQQVNDYLKRFAYEVRLNNHAIKAAQEILKNCKIRYKEDSEIYCCWYYLRHLSTFRT